jgi:hypothetical protein
MHWSSITGVEQRLDTSRKNQHTWRENIDILNFHFLPTFAHFVLKIVGKSKIENATST